MASSERSKLCRVCRQINFAAILTPREWDKETGRYKPIFRPEWDGNGEAPNLRFTGFGKTKRTGPPEVYLPQIRTADYDELSLSTQSDVEGNEPQKMADLGNAHKLQPPADMTAEDPPIQANSSLAADLSDAEGESDQVSDKTGTEDYDGDSADDGNSDHDDDSDHDGNSEYDDNGDRDGNSDYDDDDDDDESGSSASTWSNHSHYTEIQRIDLEKQAQGCWDYYHGQLYHLGSVWDLRSRRHECDLCRRLWRQTRRNPDITNEYLTKSRCIMKLMGLKGKKTDGSDEEVVMLNLSYIYGYKLDDPRNGEWIVRVSLVLQGTHRDICDLGNKKPPGQVIPFDDRLFGQARWRQDECDYGLFREWLKTCETKHNHRAPEITGEMAIRLIDVQRKCLVEWNGPTSEAPRFVTLSYMWGMSQQKAMLTTDQLSGFKQPGFLNRPLDRTIRDSMELVDRIGEKYLWIDALCILQDSREDKAVQIPQMHKIYGKAVLTIVAAYGHSADSGLPGVGEASRRGTQFKLELDDIRISFRSHTKVFAAFTDIGFRENYLKSSVYQSRAWTFQEGYLSTRVLVFTADQVYWECEKCSWCEETHWESDTIDFIGWRAIKNATPDDEWEDRFQRHAYDYDPPKKPEPLRNSYAALAKVYSMRHLSYDEDIVDGCMGVLSSIKEREQSDFLFALRTRYFGNDLLFDIMKAKPRRFPGQTSVESGFPTWSWVSWYGVVEIANEPQNNSADLVENLIPCDGVRCYMLETDQHGRKSLRVINETGGWQFRSNYVRKGEGIYDLTGFYLPTRDSHHNSVNDDTTTSKPEGVDEYAYKESEDGGGDANVRSDLKSEPAEAEEDSRPSGLSEDISESMQDQSKLTELSETFESDADSPEPSASIPEYSQTLTLADIESHPAFSRIVPKFHIIFRTFSTTVFLRTEWDEMSVLMSNVVMAGTLKTRRGGVWENQDPYQRKLFVCKKKAAEAILPVETGGEHGSTHDKIEHSPAGSMEGPSACPCCGKDSSPTAVPDGFELGPYLGRLPPLSTSWNAMRYMDAIPDGIYRLLWMNNNQLPMFGHLLCKPASESAPEDGDWDGEILQRVSGVVGPPGILERWQQERYAAKWGTFILG